MNEMLHEHKRIWELSTIFHPSSLLTTAGSVLTERFDDVHGLAVLAVWSLSRLVHRRNTELILRVLHQLLHRQLTARCRLCGGCSPRKPVCKNPLDLTNYQMLTTAHKSSGARFSTTALKLLL
jgi:hypothetical protein